MLIHNPAGHYRFLSGIDPYSCGVTADAGWEIVRVTPERWLPWREGFDWIDAQLQQAGLGRPALCAMELRSPKPFSMEGFIQFNQGYCSLLKQWDLLLDGRNPIARTNVAPEVDPPAEVCLHAFSFVRPNPSLQRGTFVVAGAGELREGTLVSQGIIRRGDTSTEAMLEKADYVLDVMENRLTGLGFGWNDVTAVDVYTVHPLEDGIREHVVTRVGPAMRRGLCWHLTYPPVIDIEFEMDVRGLACELEMPAKQKSL